MMRSISVVFQVITEAKIQGKTWTSSISPDSEWTGRQHTCLLRADEQTRWARPRVPSELCFGVDPVLCRLGHISADFRGSSPVLSFTESIYTLTSGVQETNSWMFRHSPVNCREINLGLTQCSSPFQKPRFEKTSFTFPDKRHIRMWRYPGAHWPLTGFPGGSVVKNSPADARDAGSIPGLGRSPGEGNGKLPQYPCPESFMDRGA